VKRYKNSSEYIKNQLGLNYAWPQMLAIMQEPLDSSNSDGSGKLVVVREGQQSQGWPFFSDYSRKNFKEDEQKKVTI
jgi:hypothetical protein